MTAAIKDSLLNQIRTIQENIDRLRTIIELDMADGIFDDNVPIYCALKIKIQADNIEKELSELKAKTKN